MTSSFRKSSTAESHYVTSPSQMTMHARDRLSYVTHIPDVCRHNVYGRCAVAPPRQVIGSSLSCDFSTCGKESRDTTRLGTLGGGLGEVYYDRMCELIDRQLELGTGDRLCYVGDGRAGRVLAGMLTERYCLVQPAVIVDPSDTDASFQSTAIPSEHGEPRRTIPVPLFKRFNDVFALRYSRSQNESHFDKIVVVDSLQHLVSAAERSPEVGTSNHLSTALLQLMRPLTEGGRLLIVHRPAGLNTLPLPSAIAERRINGDGDVPLDRIVSTVESMGLVLRWTVERVPIVTTRRRWVDLIEGGFPRSAVSVIDDGTTAADHATPNVRGGAASREDQDDAFQTPVVISSSTTGLDRGNGIGELTGGVLRYAGNDVPVEFIDRLALVTVTRYGGVNSLGPHRQTPTLAAKIKAMTIGGIMDIEADSELGRYVEAMRTKKEDKPNLFR